METEKETVGRPLTQQNPEAETLGRSFLSFNVGGRTPQEQERRMADREDESRYAYSTHYDKYSTGNVGALRDGLPPPSPFEGRTSEDAETWLKNFYLWAEIRRFDTPAKVQIFPYLLKGGARTWYETQKDKIKRDWDALGAAFLHRYVIKGPLLHAAVAKVFCLVQNGPVMEYLENLYLEGKRCGFDDDLLISAAIKGLKPEIKSFVLQQDVKDWESLCKVAFIAESSVKPADDVLQQIAKDLKTLQKQIEDGKTINVIEAQSTVSAPRSWAPPQRGGRQFRPTRYAGPPPANPPRPSVNQRWQPQNPQAHNYMQNSYRPDFRGGRPTPRRDWTGRGTGPTNMERCGRCGRNRHEQQEICPATNKICHFCGATGHLQSCCFAKRSLF